MGGTNNASLTLPTLGAGSSLSPGKTIVIDTTDPSASSVTSSAASGTYGLGTVFSITVNFSTVVAVTGTPELALNSGGTASYSSGSGSKGLVFSYTVSAGNAATALDYSSTSALSLNGGTIVQAGLMGGTNNASLTLPTLGAGSSLSPGKTIVIDTTDPSAAPSVPAPPAAPTVLAPSSASRSVSARPWPSPGRPSWHSTAAAAPVTAAARAAKAWSSPTRSAPATRRQPWTTAAPAPSVSTAAPSSRPAWRAARTTPA